MTVQSESFKRLILANITGLREQLVKCATYVVGASKLTNTRFY